MAAQQFVEPAAMTDFAGKIIVVTGSATGLGAAIAIGAAQGGAEAVILNCTKSLAEAEDTAAHVRAAGAHRQPLRPGIARVDQPTLPPAKRSQKPPSLMAASTSWRTMPASPSMCPTMPIWTP